MPYEFREETRLRGNTLYEGRKYSYESKKSKEDGSVPKYRRDGG
jgi:hypothetical protein